MMNKIKLARPVETTELIDQVETEYNVKIPLEVKEFLKKNSCGKLSEKEFFIGKKEYFLDRFISISPVQSSNILFFTYALNEEEGKTYIPIGTDGFGNCFCLKYVESELNGIVFMDLEMDEITYVCDSFSEFLKILDLSEES